MGSIFLILFSGISFVHISGSIHFLMIDFCISLLSFFFLQRANYNQPRYFASFWVEAVPIFWMGLLGVYFLMT